MSITNNEKPPLRLLIHAVDGAIPYLTPDLLKKCFPSNQVKDCLWVGLSVRDICVTPIMNATKPSGYTFSNTVKLDPWLSEYSRIVVPTFDPCLDAKQFSPKKIADSTTVTANKKSLMVWTDNGRQSLSAELYCQAAEALLPQAQVSLFDVSLPDATQKRRRAALQRTMEWGKHMIERQQENKSTNLSQVWLSYSVGPKIEVNLDNKSQPFDSEVEERKVVFQKCLKDKSVAGVAFVGWQYEKSLTRQTESLRAAVHRLQLQPNHSAILAVLSTNSLSHIIECYRIGISVIGTNLPAWWAKSKKAFVCRIAMWRLREPKRLKMEGGDILSLDFDCCHSVLDSKRSWLQDDRPILPGCACLTCQNHSRAYLYHLAITKELLSEILLFIHNLHHLLALFRELNTATNEGKQDEIYQHLQTQILNQA